jgi:hypothetical protein
MSYMVEALSVPPEGGRRCGVDVLGAQRRTA